MTPDPGSLRSLMRKVFRMVWQWWCGHARRWLYF